MKNALACVAVMCIATACTPSETAQKAGAGPGVASAAETTESADEWIAAQETSWRYFASKNRMTDQIIHSAHISSTQMLPATGPYAAQRLGLAVIDRGLVTLSTSDQQFDCTGIDGCRVQVRFDGEKALTFQVHELGNIKPPALAFDDGANFVTALQGHKEMLVQVDIFDEGSEAVSFSIAGYDEAKRKAAIP